MDEPCRVPHESIEDAGRGYFTPPGTNPTTKDHEGRVLSQSTGRRLPANSGDSVSSLQPTQSSVLRPDIFISYVEEDGSSAARLAVELRAQHLSTWTYEEDGVPGISYLTQVHQAIES